MHESPRSSHDNSTAGRVRGLVQWILYCGAFPVAGLAAMSVNSVFAGHRALGTLQAFGLGALVLGSLAFALTPAASRHRFLSRLITASSVMGMLALLVLQNKVSELASAGASTTRVAFGPTMFVLVIQLGLALAYLLRSRQQPSRRGGAIPWWAWSPAVAFVPAFVIVGFLGGELFGRGEADSIQSASVPVEDTVPAHDEFVSFPSSADIDFARETTRAGEDFSGDFTHYNTGRKPLVGLSCSTRDWQLHKRIDEDFRGIFDPDATVDAEQHVLAYPGYVVVALQAQVDENVHAVRVQFARLDPDGPAMSDTYWSDWIGGTKSGLEVVEIGGTGDLVLGVTGTAGLVLNSVGLLIDNSAPPEAFETRMVAR